MNPTDVKSYSLSSYSRRQRYVRFEEATNEQLREWLAPIGDVGRQQLLALARNRWGDGYLEIEEFTRYSDTAAEIRLTEAPFHMNSG